MANTTASVRDLRNRFPAIRRLLDSEGEVLLTEKGEPCYRLTRYTQAPADQVPPVKDYMQRLRRHQPRSMGAEDARALHEDNRGER